MAIHHAASGELINIRLFGDAFDGARTTTLYKTDHLEVFRMVMAAGKSIPEHTVVGEYTVQYLEGSFELSISGVAAIMRQGDLISLLGCVAHAFTAIEGCSVLVTQLLHGA